MSNGTERGNGRTAMTGPRHDVRGHVTDGVRAEVRVAPSTAVGLVRDARHRYSWNGGPLYPSVTTILGIKDKPALVGWAKRETAACAVRNLDVLDRMVPDRRTAGARGLAEADPRLRAGCLGRPR